MIEGKIFKEGNEVCVRFQPLVGRKTVEHRIASKKGEWAIKSITGTTDMTDWIGNVTKIHGKLCSVRGVYRGKMRELQKIRVESSDIKKVGDRVMVTEHLNVAGKFDFIATKKRVLVQGKTAGINFLNLGWSNEYGSRYLVIDIYTGEAGEWTGDPIFMKYED